MKKFVIISLALLLLFAAVLAAGCDIPPKLIEPALGENFELPIGRDAVVLDQDLRLTFEDVSEDSRCPLGVNCIWEGQAVYTILFKKDKETKAIEFTEAGLGGEGSAEIFGYTVTTLLQPYPATEEPIALEDYYLSVTVIK